MLEFDVHWISVSYSLAHIRQRALDYGTDSWVLYFGMLEWYASLQADSAEVYRTK